MTKRKRQKTEDNTMTKRKREKTEDNTMTKRNRQKTIQWPKEKTEDNTMTKRKRQRTIQWPKEKDRGQYKDQKKKTEDNLCLGFRVECDKLTDDTSINMTSLQTTLVELTTCNFHLF